MKISTGVQVILMIEGDYPDLLKADKFAKQNEFEKDGSPLLSYENGHPVSFKVRYVKNITAIKDIKV